MSAKHYISVFLFAFCFIMISSLSHAEQRGIGNIGASKMTVSPAKQGLKPLQQPLVANKLAAPSSYQLLLLTIDNVIASKNDLNNSICCPAPADILMSGYKDRINYCLTKSYSVQDQQAAGCAGTDTVNQCMDKLYKYCIGNYTGEYGSKEAFKQQFKTALERAKDINTKSKKYSDQLQTLLNNMP